MRFIQKFFQRKKLVENFIKENGMEAAIQEFGINKLVMFKLLYYLEGKDLYCDSYPYTITSYYDKNGKRVENIEESGLHAKKCKAHSNKMNISQESSKAEKGID